MASSASPLYQAPPGDSVRAVGNPKSENWFDPAGLNPTTGEPWRVCDMVATLEAALGRAHNDKRTAAWLKLWNELDDPQRGHYKQARGRRPRRRD